MSPQDLQALPRGRLTELARSFGVPRWKSLTRTELIAELQKTSENGLLSVEVVSPYWLSVRWHLSPGIADRLAPSLGSLWRAAVPFLVVYQCGDPETTVASRRRLQTLRLPQDATLWHIQLESPGDYYQVDLEMGICPEDATPVAHSALIRTGSARNPENGFHPETKPSDVPRSALPLFLKLECELLVHGETSPGASIRIDDERLEVDDDGRFQTKRRLVDGRTMLPILATAADGADRRTTAVVVEHHSRPIEPDRSRNGERVTR